MAATVPRIRAACIKGYEGDSCDECGNFTLLRNGTCLQCDPAAFRSRLPGEGVLSQKIGVTVPGCGKLSLS
jgi:hypothetical protein